MIESDSRPAIVQVGSSFMRNCINFPNPVYDAQERSRQIN
ncbi:hypothetical protein NIES2104_29280 [Leptolyngbya sp. NIES-2104]|nr:hypothetical protein NIES2104_29280 [Leptolyngbya sp. NIES-2104]